MHEGADGRKMEPFPFSYYFIRLVPSGTLITIVGDGSLKTLEPSGHHKTIPRCEYPIHHVEQKSRHGRAWKAFAQQDNNRTVSYLSVDWNVPSVRYRRDLCLWEFGN